MTFSSSFAVEVPHPFSRTYCVEYHRDRSLSLLLYVTDLIKLVLTRDLRPHLHADDTQLYGCCSLDQVLAFQERVTEYINDVATWMWSNCRQLNAAKIEDLWCASGHHQGQLLDVPFTVGSNTVKLVCCIRDLVIYLDSDVFMRTHASKAVASCFAPLRQIRSIQCLVSRPVLLLLVA